MKEQELIFKIFRKEEYYGYWSFDKGVLTITLTKDEKVKKKQIKIKAA